MTTQEIKINALQFENGNILIGVDVKSDSFYVQTTDGIMCYNGSEMAEIYKFYKV